MLMPRNDSAPVCYGLTYANGGEGGKTKRPKQRRMIRLPPGVAASSQGVLVEDRNHDPRPNVDVGAHWLAHS